MSSTYSSNSSSGKDSDSDYSSYSGSGSDSDAEDENREIIGRITSSEMRDVGSSTLDGSHWNDRNVEDVGELAC